MNNTNRADRSPEKWESDLPISDDQQTEALVFMLSLRGRYIMGRAMYEIIHQLEQVTGADRENSDIQDYRFIRDSLFNIFPDTLYNEDALDIKRQLHTEKNDE